MFAQLFRIGPWKIVRSQLLCLFFLLMTWFNVFLLINSRYNHGIHWVCAIGFVFNAWIYWSDAQKLKRPPRETLGEFFRKHMPEQTWCDGCKKFSNGPFCSNCK